MTARIREKLVLPLYRALQHWQADGSLQLAAAVSYYMALSFFPLVLILLSASGLFLRFTGWGQNAQAQLLEMIKTQTAPGLADQVASVLNSVQSQAVVGGPLGLVMLLVAAIAIFAQLDRAFDAIFNVPPHPGGGPWRLIRGVLWDRLRAFLMLLGAGSFLILAFVATMSFSAAEPYVRRWLPLPGIVWTLISLTPSVVINWLLFAVIYRVLPKVPVRWSEAARGALLTSVLWEIGRRILASLVVGSKYNAYGVVGAFIAMMLWVYYAVAMVFLGAEYVQVICKACKPASQPGDGQS